MWRRAARKLVAWRGRIPTADNLDRWCLLTYRDWYDSSFIRPLVARFTGEPADAVLAKHPRLHERRLQRHLTQELADRMRQILMARDQSARQGAVQLAYAYPGVLLREEMMVLALLDRDIGATHWSMWNHSEEFRSRLRAIRIAGYDPGVVERIFPASATMRFTPRIVAADNPAKLRRHVDECLKSIAKRLRENPFRAGR